MKKVLGRVLAGTMILAALAGCSSEEDTVIMAPVPQVNSQFTPEKQWSASIGDGVGHYFSKLQPVIAYEKIFIASRDGEVKALDPESGKMLWRTDLEQDDPARLSGGLNASYGKVFVGSENGDMFALDAESGELVWRSEVAGEVLAKPATDANLVMVHTSRGILVALNAETGEEAWSISTEVPNLTLRGGSAPVTVSGGVFWGTANGRLAAAVVSRGQLIWQQAVGTPKGSTEIDRLIDVDSSPVVLGSMLYTVGINGQLTAIDLRSGSPAWKRSYSSALDMATDGAKLYLVTDKDYLVAVDVRSGTELWQNKQLENRLLTSPVLIDNYIVVGDAEGYLHWLDKESGEFVAQQLLDSSGFAVAPLVLDDGYVVTTRDGDVRKLKVEK
ncbi:outer membrane protein assembly factor BamB [Vibrio sp. SCSIO 43137]|uniref:outer membrane protein assembly factor BamB n=1 Tax=Vibrio sp. SCSIO 43137 TaxID=3021011 RepID=UPI002308014D|nr:outer membrane protein assembly factor BamB [Vibrio sp. SCSIO 43137]WCE30303.1 outer membrane protein assembly factor BamB [Vibrio sp. SCSIO 43137]